MATPEIAPAPWRLTGSGYILLLGGIGTVMAVRYTSSGVGPYDELLCIPRLLPPYTISRIYVSTEASVASGRANWAIPKERADFVIARAGDADVVRVADAAGPIAELRLRAAGPSLPISTAPLPPPLRTLAQQLDGRRLLTTPSGRGRARPARLLSAWSDPARFPALSGARALAAVGVDDFVLRFPAARPDLSRAR
jgi:hypothetical protein